MRIPAFLSVALFLSALALPARSDDKKHDPHAAAGKSAAFEQFKQLAGDWVGKEVGGSHDVQGEVRVSYKLTAGGSTVVETMFPGTPHEMVTVIHPDGKDLMLTHYCMLGNQPRMKADGAGDGKTVAFKFSGASNLKSDKAMHMHDATYTFVDKDTVKSEWINYDGGKEAGKVVFELKRKK